MDLYVVLNELPNEYDKKKYMEFIEIFGSHVVVEAKLGGWGKVKTQVKKSYQERSGSSNIKIQAGAEFQFLKFNVEAERSRRQNSGEYVENSSVHTEVFGGDSTNLRLKDWDHWVKSIPLYPRKTSYRVEPISELIKDTVKKANIERAVNEYISENQRVENNLREVPNCFHVIRASEPPRNVIRNVGVFDGYTRGSSCADNHVYLVNGPDVNDRCAVSWAYRRNWGNTNLESFEGISYSETVNVFIEKKY